MLDEGEKCQRCGEIGEDRRTLWMACFYRMSELSVPFQQCALHSQYQECIGERELTGLPGMSVPEWSEPAGYFSTRPFYTLRVCKACRADWMRAIANWFDSEPSSAKACGSGIYVRNLGVSEEITDEEWRRRNSNAG